MSIVSGLGISLLASSRAEYLVRQFQSCEESSAEVTKRELALGVNAFSCCAASALHSRNAFFQ